MTDQIREIIEEIGDNDGYYNCLKVLPWWDDVIMINPVGGRGIGKTDYLLHIAIMLYQRYGCQTTWIRHKLNELTEEGNYSSFLNDPKAFGWCPEDWDARPDGVYISRDREADQVIIFASISTFSNKRGAGHPRVLMMVFDEMIPEDGRYRPNRSMCVKGLLSLMESMTRGRDGSMLFVASNFVKASNPYWVRFRITNNPKYDVTVFRDKAIAIEVCRGYKRARKDDSKLTRLMKAGGMPMYEDAGQEDAMASLVRDVPKGAKPMPYIILTGGLTYREYYHKGVSYWTDWKGKAPNGTIILTDNLSDAGEGIEILPRTFYKRQEEAIQSDLVRFKTANVMYAILGMIYDVIR